MYTKLKEKIISAFTDNFGVGYDKTFIDKLLGIIQAEIPLHGLYKGKNIHLSHDYICTKSPINKHIKFIKFFGYLSETPGQISCSLEIRFNNGYYKSFIVDTGDDGSFPEDSFSNALEKADNYLDNLTPEDIPESPLIKI